jgi:hypothetical protein
MIRGPYESDELPSDANRHFSQTQPLPTHKPSGLRERDLKNLECARLGVAVLGYQCISSPAGLSRPSTLSKLALHKQGENRQILK